MSTARSTGPAAFIDTNVVGTFTLLEAARAYWGGTRRLPLPPCLDRRGLRLARRRRGASPRRRPTRRARPIRRPRPPATTWCAPGARPTACRWCITNCSNNYGPFHFPEKLIPVVILNALAGREIPVYGQGRERARLALSSRTTPGRCSRSPSAAGSARATTSAATPRRRTSTSCAAICALMDELRARGRAARAADPLRRRPAGPRLPLRDRRRARSATSSAGRRR